MFLSVVIIDWEVEDVEEVLGVNDVSTIEQWSNTFLSVRLWYHEKFVNWINFIDEIMSNILYYNVVWNGIIILRIRENNAINQNHIKSRYYQIRIRSNQNHIKSDSDWIKECWL